MTTNLKNVFVVPSSSYTTTKIKSFYGLKNLGKKTPKIHLQYNVWYIQGGSKSNH